MNSQMPAANAQNSSRYKSQELYSDSNADNVQGVKVDLAQERKTISHWVRDDLEDKYLRLLDDHQVLKKHARLQEMKIKKMSTKMLKLTSDAKKNGDITPKKEESEDLQRKCSILESQNVLMKDKLKLLQSQLLAQGKKPSVYDNVPPRIRSGNIERSNSVQNFGRKNNIRVIKPRGEIFPLSPRRDEPLHGGDQSNIALNKLVEDLKYELHRQQMENEELVKRSYWKDGENINPDHHRTTIKDNLELIRVGRDVKEKEVQINVMQARYEDLKLKQQHLERSNHEMSDEIARLHNRLQSTDEFAGSAEGQIRNTGVLMKRIADLETMSGDQKKEIFLLKEANNKLTNNAFNTERERDWREKEMTYRAKIAQLEMTLKRDVGEKGGVLNKLESERDRTDNAEKEMSNLRLRNYEMQAKIDELSEKLKFFSKDASLNPQEIEEALMIIQHKRNMAHAQSTPELDFIQKVDRKKDQDLPRRLQESETNHADTIQELEKTRSLLRTQYKISNDYRLESEKISSRLEELKRDYEDRLSEYARLLDIRAARIQKLEAQLKDIAYGTRNTQIETILEPDVEPLASDVLERGENILEIHIGRVTLTQQAIDTIRDKDPFLFGTWDFYDFETQATGVLRGTSSEFNIKAEYLVKIDDFFLNYLYKNTFSFELHQATGAEYVTLAACQLSCRDLFDRTAAQTTRTGSTRGSMFNCRARLVGLRDSALDINFGLLEYWIRLRHPMDQVIRQYREKLKAEGYIAGNDMALVEAGRPIESMNELAVRIIRCRGLRSRQSHLQPSPYIAYTFYDHQAHTTVTIASSNSPEFHDLKRFPVQMNGDLHQYLKSQNLQIYVFDELDPDDSVYLGVAAIPMIQLSHNKNIGGSFELYDSANVPNGTIEVEINWQHSYLYRDTAFDSPINAISLLPGEENIASEDQPSRQSAPAKEDKRVEQVMSPRKSPVHEPVKEAVKEPPKKKERQKKPIKQKSADSGLISPPNVEVVKGILRKTVRAESDKSLADSLKDKDVMDSFVMPDVEIKETSPVASAKSNVEGEIKMTSSAERNEEARRTLEAVSKKLEKVSVTGDNSIDSVSGRDSSPVKTPSASSSKVTSGGTDGSDSKKKKKPSKKGASKSSESSTGPVTGSNLPSENDDVVMVRQKKAAAKKSILKPELSHDEILVEIISVELEEDAAILKDDSIKHLFVEYRLPGISSELTETISLKKPSPSQHPKTMNYNFRKTFDVSFNNNYTMRRHIATMLTEDANKHIVFTIVQEPSEESDSDCEDIGSAKVDVKAMLRDDKNLDNERLPIYSFKDANVLIGHIHVTIKILGVLRAIEKELKKA